MHVVTEEQLEALGQERPDPTLTRRGGQALNFAGRQEFDLAAWIEHSGVLIKREGEWNRGGYRYVLEECPWNGHKDASAYIVRFANGAIAAGCHHNSCQGYGWRELREHYEPGCYDSPDRETHIDPDDGAGSIVTTAQLPPVPPFPLTALPLVLRTFVKEAAQAIGCPIDVVALPALATLGAAIGNSRVLLLKRGWTEGAAVYAAVVAAPGEKKTPAQKVATRPAWGRQAVDKRAYDEAMVDYQREKAAWEAERRRASREEEPAPAPPEEPTMRRTVVDDATVEALAVRLEHNPRGLLCAKDELSAWVRGQDQYKGGKGADRQFWLSVWSNSPAVVDRKHRPDPQMIFRPFVALVGSIQPGILSELKNHRDDGLLDRFLYAYPDSMPSRWSDDEIAVETVALYGSLYDSLNDLHMDLDESGEPAPQSLQFTASAKDLFVAEVDSLREEMEGPGFPEHLKGPWSKLEAYLARLSLILALVRIVGEQDVASPFPTEEVTEGDVRAAAALLAYFKAHARRVHARLHGERPEFQLAEALKAFMAENGGSWEGQTSGLYEILKARSAPGLPGGEGPFGKRLRQIVRQDPDLDLKERWRGSDQVVRITLSTPGTPGPRPSGTLATGGTGGRIGHPDAPSHDVDEPSTSGEDSEVQIKDETPDRPADHSGEGDDSDTRAEGGPGGYLAEKERRLGPGWRSKAPDEILAELGWARTAITTEDGYGKGRAPTIDTESDPVALEIRRWVFSEEGYASTARALSETPERFKEWDFPRFSGWWPDGPREMQDHLERLAPVLLGAGVLAEYWEKKGARTGKTGVVEGFWIFLPAGQGRSTAERVEERVWSRVAYLEGMGSVFDNFLDDIG